MVGIVSVLYYLFKPDISKLYILVFFWIKTKVLSRSSQKHTKLTQANDVWPLTSTTKVTPRPVVPTKLRLFGATGATAVVNFIASPMGTNNIYNTRLYNHQLFKLKRLLQSRQRQCKNLV